MTIETRERFGPEDELNDLVGQLVGELRDSLRQGGSVRDLTPSMIREVCPAVYFKIIAILPKKPVGGKPERDWDPFYKVLLKEHPAWAERWVTPERKRELALDRQAAQIVAALRARHWTQPLNPSVITEIYGNYQHLSRLLPTAGVGGRERDWSPVVARLEEFAPLWIDRQRRQEQSLARAVQQFAAWLKDRPLGIITPRRLRNENPKLYNQFRYLVHDKAAGWDVVINHPLFPNEWREYWQSKRSGKFISADITRARAELAREQPATVGPAWLEKHLGRAFHQRVVRRLPHRYGVVDWREFVRALDKGQPPEKQWGDKWPVTRAGHNAQREVEAVLEEHRGNLHAVLVDSDRPEDIESRDTIVQAFINLAQLGNTEAERKLFILLKSVIDKFLKTDKTILYYAEDNDALEKIFARCVATFRPDKNGNFINYLRQQLRLTAQVGHGRGGISF